MPKSLPKSGCACVAAPIVLTQAADAPFTGKFDTSACHTLSAGKIAHFRCTGGEASGDGDTGRDGSATAGDGPLDGDGSAVTLGWAEHDDSSRTVVIPTRIRRTPVILLSRPSAVHAHQVTGNVSRLR